MFNQNDAGILRGFVPFNVPSYNDDCGGFFVLLPGSLPEYKCHHNDTADCQIFLDQVRLGVVSDIASIAIVRAGDKIELSRPNDKHPDSWHSQSFDRAGAVIDVRLPEASYV